MKIRISAFQMKVSDSIPANEAKLLKAIESAAKAKADILLSPEGSLSGYTSNFNQDELALCLDSVVSKAASLSVGLALGTCFHESNGLCYNQIRVYSADGEYQGFHAKILRCSPLVEGDANEMKEFATTPLRAFRLKGKAFGCLVCNDLWATPGWTTSPNPYLAWQLKKLGAAFILHAVNSGSDQKCRPFHESNLSLWASALELPIVTVNAVPDHGEANASSGVLAPGGRWLLKIPAKGEKFFCSDIDV